jgi:acetyl-CoA acetyltransferase
MVLPLSWLFLRGTDRFWWRLAYFALYARRRMELFGATREDFARVKVKNAKHGLAILDEALDTADALI